MTRLRAQGTLPTRHNHMVAPNALNPYSFKTASMNKGLQLREYLSVNRSFGISINKGTVLVEGLGPLGGPGSAMKTQAMETGAF